MFPQRPSGISIPLSQNGQRSAGLGWQWVRTSRAETPPAREAPLPSQLGGIWRRSGRNLIGISIYIEAHYRGEDGSTEQLPISRSPPPPARKASALASPPSLRHPTQKPGSRIKGKEVKEMVREDSEEKDCGNRKEEQDKDGDSKGTATTAASQVTD